jgi:hypothetical protein
MSTKIKINALQLKIAKLQELEEKLSDIRTLESYTVEEKIKFFDILFESAKYMLDKSIEDGYWDEDNDHYAYEDMIKILGEDIFDIIDNIDKFKKED